MKIILVVFCLLFSFGVYSQNAPVCSGTLQTPQLSIEKEVEAINQTLLLNQAWPCTKDILYGVWDATGGFAISAGECAVSPLQCAKRATTAISGAYEFLTNITQKVSSSMRTLSELPIDQRSEIICSLIGSLGTDILIAVLTAGAASGKLASTLGKIYLSIQKLASIGKNLAGVPLKVLASLGETYIHKAQQLVLVVMEMKFEML